MLLAKSRPIVVICIADASHFARERLMAFTLWHPDAVSGSHPPHLLLRASGKHMLPLSFSAFDPGPAYPLICPSGCFASPLSSAFRKNISLRRLVETALWIPPS